MKRVKIDSLEEEEIKDMAYDFIDDSRGFYSGLGNQYPPRW